MKGCACGLKVSVITLIDVNNYGTMLQAFATQKKLEEYADDVEIIDYQRKTNSEIAIIIELCRSNLLRGLAYIPSVIIWRRLRKEFIKKHLKTSASHFKSNEEFDNFPLHDGIYCTGSDQVWNTDYNQGVVHPLYLSFVPCDMRKFAYAASFGKDWLDEEMVAKSKKYIEQYERISVRESDGVKILDKLYGYQDAVHLVDPTLAMPPEFWRGYACEPKIEGEYILIYCLNQSKAFETYAKKLSEKTGLPIFRLCHRVVHMILCGKKILIPLVFEFITLIDNAKYVLTDSFHGTAFSMNLNTEPIVIYPGRYSGRLSSFLNLVGAQHRAISDFNDFDVINRPVDFAHVNKVLAYERERVDEFLRSIFHGEG